MTYLSLIPLRQVSLNKRKEGILCVSSFFLHFFMYGILLIAINTNAYGEMAYNMALSIKAHSKIPVCLLTDNNGLSSLPDKNNFDEIINVDLQDVLHEGKMNPFFLKTNIYKYSPF